MMARLRSLPLPVLLAVLPLALAPLAGCMSSSSSATASGTATATAAASSAAATSAAPSVTASAPASASPAQPATTPASPATATATATASAAGTGTAQPPGREVFLAEGGDVRGTTVYRVDCASGCPLSGDGTTALWNMTWTTWNATEAVGAGTEKIDDCNPNCAAGTLHAVAVRVTLSNPVMVCQPSTGAWYWTRVTFTWPNGLPAVFSGDNAPTNPFNYQDITAQQAKSCS